MNNNSRITRKFERMFPNANNPQVNHVECHQQSNFQSQVAEWVHECFGEQVAMDKKERNYRFLEESLELVQSIGCTASDAHALVDYVFNRPEGETFQEVGGVMVTLAALCHANGISMTVEGDKELARVHTIIDKIRSKHANKPINSPLPIKQEVAVFPIIGPSMNGPFEVDWTLQCR